MSELLGIKRYLHGMSVKGGGRGGFPFVTISRQAGAGGRTMALEIQKQMQQRGGALMQGWHTFDNEICEKVAMDPNITVSIESLLTEEFRSSLADYLAQLLARDTPQIKVYREIFSLVRSLAKVGKSLIVGRGGVCLTRRLAGGVHIRLVAPMDFRVLRMAKRFDIDKDEAKRWISEQDASRRKMIRTYFKQDIEDPLLYDTVLNTEAMGFESAASVVLRMVEDKAGALKSPTLSA